MYNNYFEQKLGWLFCETLDVPKSGKKAFNWLSLVVEGGSLVALVCLTGDLGKVQADT